MLLCVFSRMFVNVLVFTFLLLCVCVCARVLLFACEIGCRSAGHGGCEEGREEAAKERVVGKAPGRWVIRRVMAAN